MNMEDEELTIEVCDSGNEIENMAVMLLAFIINKFDGVSINPKLIERIVLDAGGPFLEPAEINRILSQTILLVEHWDMLDRVGFNINGERFLA